MFLTDKFIQKCESSSFKAGKQKSRKKFCIQFSNLILFFLVLELFQMYNGCVTIFHKHNKLTLYNYIFHQERGKPSVIVKKYLAHL